MNGHYLFHRSWPRPTLTGLLYGLGYALLAACYVPQWLAILDAPGAAVEAVSAVFLGAVSSALVLLQWALMRDRYAHRALRWGNLVALANALITDAAWLWAALR